MKQNRIAKALEDYEKKRKTWATQAGAFTCLDIPHVIQATEHETPAEIAEAALKAGFMIGYRKGQRDARKGAR